MGYFLGVDGGQTATVAAIGDAAGRVLGAGAGGPCNHVRGPGGRKKFVSAIQTALERACQAAGLDPKRIGFRAACLGFSGGPEDKRDIVAELVRAERLLVTTDAVIALMGATGGEPGVIVIAGTGSIAFGRNAAGRSARAGGWGYIFGDEGGAFDIVRQALRAALRFEEGWGPATALHGALLEATGAASANELLHLFYTRRYPRPRIAGLAPLVDETARRGDEMAVEILRQAAQRLATYAAAVRRQLFRPEEPVAVAYIGGVFASAILRERFRTLVELEETARVVAPRYRPEYGALIEAWRAAGLKPELQSPSS